MALLGRAWSAYSAALVARPLPTKVASGVAIYALGDTSAQRVEWYARAQERLGADPRAAPEAFRWNRWRTLRMCLYGGVWMSPFLHVWYRSLDAMLVGRALFAGRAPLLAVSKLALDQSFAATTNMMAFYTINGLMEGQSLLQVRDTLRQRLFPTMLNLWSVWVPVQAVNLTVVPLHNRVLVVNIVGVGWSCFMSWYGNQPVQPVNK